MKTHIRDALQIVAAILITSGLVASAAPLPTPSQASITPDVPTTKIVATPVKEEKPVEPTPVPVVPTTAPDPEPVVQPAPVAVTYSGSHTDMLAEAGIAPADYEAADFIIMHEGHYDPCVRYGGAVDCAYASNGGQLAYGVCQALPGSKMASAGADWATNPVTQLKWCNSYAVGRYGSWAAARNYWVSYRSW